MPKRNKQNAQVAAARQQAAAQIAEATRATIAQIRQAGNELSDSTRNEAMLKRMVEAGDSQLLDLIRSMQGQELLIGGGFGFGYDKEKDAGARKRELDYSRRFCAANGLARDVVKTYTAFGFGSRLDIATKDETAGRDSAQAVIDETLKSPANSYVLGDIEQKELSKNVMTDGEIIFVIWQSTHKGIPTVRRLAPECIAEIIYDKTDKTIPVWYVERTTEGVIYYPDWRVDRELALDNIPPKDAKVPGWSRLIAVQQDAGTSISPALDIPEATEYPQELGGARVAKVIHSIYNKFGKRGEPPLMPAFPWLKQVTRFMESRATVAEKSAMYVNDIEVDGGSSDVSTIVNRLQSSLVNGSGYLDRNPPPIAGSDFVHNKALRRNKIPLDTGAGDAAQDFRAFMTMAAISSVFAIELWMPYELSNRASTDRTLSRLWQAMNDYKNFWASTWRRVFYVALELYKTYNPVKATYTSFETEVSLNTPLDADPAAIVSAIGAVNESKSNGTMPEPTAAAIIERLVTLLCDAVGVDEAQSILDGIEVETPMQALAPQAQPGQPSAAPAIAPSAATPPANSGAPMPAAPSAAQAPEQGPTEVKAEPPNGAQISSAVDIVAQIIAGVLPVDSAISMMQWAFPDMDITRIMGIINPVADKLKAQPAPQPEQAATNPAITKAVERYRNGEITEAQFAEYMAAEVESLIAA